MTAQTEGTFEGWVIAEFMGHRKLGGYLKEQTIAGTTFIRLDVFNIDGGVVASQFYNPSSIYCITPCSQELAVEFGANHQPQPVTRWELLQSKVSEESKIVYFVDDSGAENEDEVDTPAWEV